MRDWLKKKRKSLGLTQAKVAELAGVSHQLYQRIEHGDYDMPVKTAKRVANALGLDWTRFYEDEKAECCNTPLNR